MDRCLLFILNILWCLKGVDSVNLTVELNDKFYDFYNNEHIISHSQGGNVTCTFETDINDGRLYREKNGNRTELLHFTTAVVDSFLDFIDRIETSVSATELQVYYSAFEDIHDHNTTLICEIRRLDTFQLEEVSSKLITVLQDPESVPSVETPGYDPSVIVKITENFTLLANAERLVENNNIYPVPNIAMYIDDQPVNCIQSYDAEEGNCSLFIQTSELLDLTIIDIRSSVFGTETSTTLSLIYVDYPSDLTTTVSDVDATNIAVTCAVASVYPGAARSLFTVKIDPDFSVQSSDSDLTEGSADPTTRAVSLSYSTNITSDKKYNGQQVVCELLWIDETTTTQGESLNIEFAAEELALVPSDETVQAGTELTLTCTTGVGNPTPTVSWEVDSGGTESTLSSTTSTETDGDYNAKYTVSTLTFPAEPELDGNIYKCQAWNLEESYTLTFPDCSKYLPLRIVILILTAMLWTTSITLTVSSTTENGFCTFNMKAGLLLAIVSLVVPVTTFIPLYLTCADFHTLVYLITSALITVVSIAAIIIGNCLLKRSDKDAKSPNSVEPANSPDQNAKSPNSVEAVSSPDQNAKSPNSVAAASSPDQNAKSPNSVAVASSPDQKRKAQERRGSIKGSRRGSKGGVLKESQPSKTVSVPMTGPDQTVIAVKDETILLVCEPIIEGEVVQVTYQWFCSNTDGKQKTFAEKAVMDGQGSIEHNIKRVTKKTVGVYFCKVEIMTEMKKKEKNTGTTKVLTSVHVNVQMDNKIVVKPSGQDMVVVASEGDDLELHCSPGQGKSSVTYSWLHTVKGKSTKNVEADDNTGTLLKILNLTKDDMGIYKYEVTHPDRKTSYSAKVVLHVINSKQQSKADKGSTDNDNRAVSSATSDGSLASTRKVNVGEIV